MNKAIKTVTEKDSEHDEADTAAKKELDLTTAKIKSKFLRSLEEEQQKISGEIDKVKSQHKSQISKDQNLLKSQRLQLERALKVAAHITEEGSPYDLANMYTALTDTLQRLGRMKPVAVEKT